MKTKLTDKEKELMDIVRDEWLERFNKLEFDEAKAKKLIRWMYKLTDNKKPNPIIVLDSPLACQIAGNILYGSQVRNQVWNQQVWNQVRNQVVNQVRNQVRNQVGSQVDNQVKDQVRSQVRNQVVNQVVNQVGNQVRNQVWIQVRNQVEDQVEDQVKDQVRSQVEGQVRSRVKDQVRSQVDNQVWNQVEDRVSSQVWSRAWSQVWNQVWNQVENQKLIYINTSYYGDMSDYGWLSFYDYFKRVGIVKNDKFKEYLELSKSGIFYLLLTDDFAFISKPPKYIKKLGNGRMNSTDGYAIEFNDGYGQYYVEGVYFDPRIFDMAFIRKTMTGKDIMNLKNTEQKAVLIKHYGYEKIISDLENVKILEEVKVKSKITGKDCTYQVIEFDIDKEITARVVMVEDHTTHKKTFLGVPREKETETCMGAISWTFNVPEKDYIPAIEA